MVCLWLYCISITKKSDTSITVIYHGMSLTVLYQYQQEEWYVYHSDLSWYVSDCTVSVSTRRVIRLSQWFIMVCLWLYCISITKKSDTSITVIYHGMSLTVLYQYHQEEWYVYHSDLSWYVSDCTVVKFKLRSSNTSCCLIQVVTKADWTAYHCKNKLYLNTWDLLRTRSPCLDGFC
jgi:hypothetical protein